MVRAITFFIVFGILINKAWSQKCPNPVLSYRQSNGCTLNICKASLIPFPGNLGKSISAPKHPPEAFLIELQFINRSSVKKIDLLSDSKFRLEDNFFNTYILLNPNRSDAKKAPSIRQSLYPHDAIAYTLIFEPPVKTIQQLVLSLDSNQPGDNKEIHLAIPKEKIDFTSLVKKTSPFVMQILTPAQYTEVKPDATIHLQLALEKNNPLPEAIYIISGDYVLEDPTSSLQYDIHIPRLTEAGLFPVHIIAKWNIHNKTRQISKTLFLTVTDPSKDCLVNCIKSNR